MTSSTGQIPPIELIPASRYTFEELAEGYNQARADYLVPMPMSARRLAEYVHDYDVSLDSSVVAVLGEVVLGMCMLGIRGERGWVTRLGVLPDSRRHHIGQRLVEHCIHQARSRALAELYVEVIEGNAPAHALFLRLGFEETQKLLILRRPPGPPSEGPTAAVHSDANVSEGAITWLDEKQTLLRAAARTERPAWTNQTETLANNGHIRGLHIAEHATGLSGWVCYEETPLHLRRVMIAPGDPCDQAGADCTPLAYALLHALHARFPALDAIAENTPANASYINAFYAQGYVESFARIEMMLRL